MIEIIAGGTLAEASGDALAVPVFADRAWGPGADWAADRLGDWLDAHLDAAEFEGKPGQVAAVPGAAAVPFATVYFVGLGDGPGTEELRSGAGAAGRAAARAATLVTTLHQVDAPDAAEAVAGGVQLGQYRFDKYRSEPKPAATEQLVLVEADDAAVAGARRGLTIAAGVMAARDLVNEPAVGKPPAEMAKIAKAIGTAHGLRVEVRKKKALEEGGFGGLLGVASGADNPPRLVEMWYEPVDPVAFLAVVGKGIIFDSGGLSIKPAAGMETMKTDMSGAAAVFGALRVIADLELPVKVVGITPLTENMTGGAAQRPGDVLRARNGKTIEVLNTDAEGRLVLADGLSLAVEAEPDMIVDLATLTGAAVVALGDKIAAVFGNGSQPIEAVKAAADRAGERVWEMPLPADYRKNIDSEVADMKNTGPRYGGAINAALLLQEFVGEVPWAHIDIAGPARAEKADGYVTAGGTGFGVRTVVALAENMAAAG